MVSGRCSRGWGLGWSAGRACWDRQGPRANLLQPDVTPDSCWSLNLAGAGNAPTRPSGRRVSRRTLAKSCRSRCQASACRDWRGPWAGATDRARKRRPYAFVEPRKNDQVRASNRDAPPIWAISRMAAVGGRRNPRSTTLGAAKPARCHSISIRFGRPTAAIHGISSGDCWKRGCSARTWSFLAASTKAYGRRFPRPIRGSRPGPRQSRHADA